MAHQRGEYGSSPRIGTASPDMEIPWWKLAIGASVILGVMGIGIALSRAPTAWPEGSVPKIRERSRAAGIKPWMSQAETERLWRAYNAKHARPASTR